MPVLPIPAIVALLLFFFAIKAQVSKSSSPLFVLLIVAMAVQNLIISLNLYYGVTAFRWVQPVSASFIPALAYMAFVSSSLRSLSWTKDAWHLVGPGLTIFALLAAPGSLDIVLPALFAIYGLTLWLAVSKGQDSLVKSRLDGGDVPVLLWRIIGAALVFSALSEGVISFDYIYNDGRWSLMIIGGFSSLILLAMGLLSLSPLLQDIGDEVGEPELSPAQDVEEQSAAAEQALVNRLEDLLHKQELFLDPSLTLAKLARKLHVPAKTLSTAVNKVSGENVSRYINAYRIRHACYELTQGHTITQAMLNSGFNTKSNFNREFLRVMGSSPSEWINKARNT